MRPPVPAHRAPTEAVTASGDGDVLCPLAGRRRLGVPGEGGATRWGNPGPPRRTSLVVLSIALTGPDRGAGRHAAVRADVRLPVFTRLVLVSFYVCSTVGAVCEKQRLQSLCVNDP